MPDFSKSTMYFQPPSNGNRITCVFENPTWREKLYGYPAAGITGSNLCLLFHILRCMESTLRKEFSEQLFRCKVCIVNGSQEVYDSSGDRRDRDYVKDVGNNSEIIKYALQSNDARRFVLCFGDRAELAVKSVMPKCKFIKVYHLSGRALKGICRYDVMVERYGIPDIMRSAMPLILIAEYIVTYYESDDFESFHEFVNPFRTNGNGVLQKDVIHVLDIDQLSRIQCFNKHHCMKEGIVYGCHETV